MAKSTEDKLSVRERKFRIHAICEQMKFAAHGLNRTEHCKRCPLHYHVKGIGWCIHGCVIHAEEVMNLGRYGMPWPPKPKGYNQRQLAWRRSAFDHD
jgi:hypothetical protein